jgi:hypothetical protein
MSDIAFRHADISEYVAPPPAGGRHKLKVAHAAEG